MKWDAKKWDAKKWNAITLTALLVVISARVSLRSASAQEVLPIGNFAHVEDRAATTWAISGYEMFRLTSTVDGDTPIVRTEKCDARATEIFSRAQAPALRASDIKVMGNKIVVRRYLLLEVTPQDARAANTTPHELAIKWADLTRRYLPKVQPYGSRFGI